jgi:hypothetical protein
MALDAGRNFEDEDTMRYTKPDVAAWMPAIGLIQSATVKFDPFLDTPMPQTYATSAAYEIDE